AVCTGLPADLQSSMWVDDAESRTLTFGTKTLSGFTFQDTGTNFDAFTCVGNVDNVYVFGSDNSVSSPTGGAAEYYYLCMRITKVSANSYYYYLLAVTTMATSGSSPTVSNSVLPIATNSQSAGQRLPDVSGVAGNSGVAGVSERSLALSFVIKSLKQ
ncbi:Hypothetical predicted protein, partial [Mytilus galloprovincialis]